MNPRTQRPIDDAPDELFEAYLERLGSNDLRPTRPPANVGSHAPLLRRLAERVALSPRYELGPELGRGGIGVVLRAQDLELDRSVAMKVLSRSEPGAEEIERFLDEARVTGQLDHPGIVTVHELGVASDGRPYFTMQLVRGRDLSSVLLDADKDSQWSTARVLQVLLRVCEAVAFAHDRGVLHRDLKPSNIMIGRFGEVYVMDWGLAKVLGLHDRDSSATGLRGVDSDAERTSGISRALTQVGTIMGTPSFMSPEQARGEVDRLDARADVYSLGAILYFVLTRRPPYCDVSRTPGEVLAEVVIGPPTPLQRLAPDTAPELVAICSKAMAHASTERYPGVLELASDLRAFLEGRVVTAHRVGVFTELRKWILRNRAIAVISTALFVAVTTGFAVSSVLYVAARSTNRDLQLSSVDMYAVRFQKLRESERELWPPGPERLAALEAWVVAATELLEDVPQLVSTVAPFAGLDPRFERLRRLENELVVISDPVEGLLHAECAPHGMSVTTRLQIARDLEWRSIGSPEARDAWDLASRAIDGSRSDSPYGALKLVPHCGLLPVGRDPRSQLWEFADLMTGDAPKRDRDTGSLAITESTGIVFVLVPGGDALIGSSADPLQPNHVPGLTQNMLNAESPAFTFRLEPYFISKYEITQAQWQRWTGENPSFNLPGAVFDERSVSKLHPVEQVSWERAVEILGRFGLELPTEIQWEYAARAGTSTPWWTGAASRSLVGNVNLADASAIRAHIPVNENGELIDSDDGWAVHAPVDAGAPNRFGMVHVLGNVSEWCQDPRTGYGSVERGRAGVALTSGARRIHRGGAFTDDAMTARSAARASSESTYTDSVLGVRPMRLLQP